MRTLALLLCLAPAALPEDAQIRVAAELPAQTLIETLAAATGATYLYPPADLAGRTVGGRYDFTVPKERLSDAADFLVRQAGLDLASYPPVQVILPQNATEGRFKAPNLGIEIEFNRAPGAWSKAEDAVGSLSKATVDALLAEAARGRTEAVDILAVMGPRTPPVADALATLLGSDATRSRAARALAHFGYFGKPALAALREAAKADLAVEPFLREVEAARHPALFDPALATGTAPQRYVVRFETTRGEFDVEVQRDWAPIGADRLHHLVRIGFFDGLRFFRVLPGAVAQFGKPGDPQVSRLWYQAKIKDDAVRESNRRGYLAFATEGKDSRTTQLFVNLKDNPDLDTKGFAPLGRVVKGMEVVDSLFGEYGTEPDEGQLHYRGDAYLEQNFPRLDRIKAATLLE